MTQTGTIRRRSTGKASVSRRRGAPLWLRLLRGLGAALLLTIAGVAVFALLMQWVKPTDTVVRVFNQVLKLAAIAVGVYVTVGRGCEGGLLRGAAVGVLYMIIGVAMYAMLSGQSAPAAAYAADLAMGVAAGGIVGMILSNISPK